ncbi:hypothetical protein PUG81_28200 [Erwiniaceae bacterium L1_54_6]|jgi:hypothetical protein|nr:hypothetical protein [Erwiniaceae bacterium L1_54_6]
MSFKLSDVPVVAGEVTLPLNDRQKLADGETLMIPLDDGSTLVAWMSGSTLCSRVYDCERSRVPALHEKDLLKNMLDAESGKGPDFDI